jgi:hypothetical protein
MGNPAREHLKKLRRQIQQKDRGDVMTQEEIDSIFNYELSEREIDKLHGIKRKPWIGWLISIVGSIIVWGITILVIYHFI